MKRFLAIVGPGLLVAATGIGAGDLATAGFAGSYLGTALLWAVAVGALLKFVVTEGLARWQLATGTTLLEGVTGKFGRGFGYGFLVYLAFWSFFVGSALMSACGVTLHALFPVFSAAETGKVVFGVLSALTGWLLVLIGGYALFEKLMKLCIAFMFVTVVVTAGLLWPGTAEVARGLFLPSIPELDSGGLGWTIALIGGVGGTVTVLCYGYWIREENRTGAEHLAASRIDLAAAYLVTALFGMAMIIIGSTIEVEGRGAGLLVSLAGRLESVLGPAAGMAFLIGAFGAVFSSLLGVWQAVPYLFSDTLQQIRKPVAGVEPVDTRSLPYRGYLAALAIVPAAGLLIGFSSVQKWYAMVGAWFFPALTLALLILNNRRDWIGERYRNGPAANAALVIVLLFFSWVAMRSI